MEWSDLAGFFVRGDWTEVRLGIHFRWLYRLIGILFFIGAVFGWKNYFLHGILKNTKSF